jgi:hypothetical protein
MSSSISPWRGGARPTSNQGSRAGFSLYISGGFLLQGSIGVGFVYARFVCSQDFLVFSLLAEAICSLIRFGLLIFNAGSTTLALDILSISLLSALLRESHGVSHCGQSDSTSPLFFPLSLWIFLVALLKK